TMIQQCKVEIDRTTFCCSMHSHISAVHNGRRIYLHTLSNSGCQRLLETGTLSLGGSAIISGAAPNSTMTSCINLAGSTTEDGRYSGTQYSDPYDTWDKVIVQATIRITFKDYEVPIERTTSQLIFPSGQRCQARRMFRFGKRADVLVSNPPG
ncbi:hypothetical protein HN011_009084, partial [Eciton burchellii]